MRSLLFTVALGVLVAFSSTAGAQNARSLTRDALSEFERGNFEEARALFLRAHELEPSARLERGAGMAAFEVRDYVQAYRLLQRALVSEDRPLTDEQRAETEALIGRTQAFLGRFRFSVQPAEASVQIDLRAPEREADGTILLAVGEHSVVVEAEGYRSREQQLEVRGGEDETLIIRLEMEGTTAGAEEPDERGREMDALSWALIGGGAGFLALAGAGIGGWAYAGGELSTCRDFEAAGGHCANEPTLETRRRTMATLTLVAGVTGLVGVTMGMLRWLWSDDDEDERAGCSPGLLALDCRWRF
ncbi:MAG: PEGA domain-containing protein [Deltaproteobacteria bacterium]|nr:PEGA domain-containing protein [Deltaproteobacteria bacterium]